MHKNNSAVQPTSPGLVDFCENIEVLMNFFCREQAEEIG